MQHRYAPGAPEAVEFYASIDRALGRLLELGAVVGITADHGMNAKQRPDGSPNVIYLESELTKKFGPGSRVILPITDPYVAHHGALGSFAVVHLAPARAGLPTLPVPPMARGHTPERENPGRASLASPSPGGAGRGEGGLVSIFACSLRYTPRLEKGPYPSSQRRRQRLDCVHCACAL